MVLVIVTSSHERSFSRKNLDDVPDEPGVYHLINNLHTIIYIGKASDLDSRLYQHYMNDNYNAYYLKWENSRIDGEASRSAMGETFLDVSEGVRRAFAVPGLRVRRFLGSHPVICLLILAPQVEYLTGSTQLSWVVLNPPLFIIFLAQNIGFYGGGVLLIREARVRWQKGWATVLFLGAAYGILEEGVGTGVLFNPQTAVSGNLGTYGHWLGINWINVTILVPIVHPLFSISLPILLLDLALPETRGESLLSTRAIWLTFAIFGIDVAVASFFVSTVLAHFYAGPVLLAGGFVAISALAWAAWLIPSDLLRAPKPRPSAIPLRFAVLGAALPWALFFVSGVLVGRSVPPVLVVLEIVAGGGLALAWVLRNIGQMENEPQKVALGTGLVAGLIPMGISSQIGTGIGLVPVLAGDLIAVLFFRYLWGRHGALPSEREDATDGRPRPVLAPNPKV